MGGGYDGLQGSQVLVFCEVFVVNADAGCDGEGGCGERAGCRQRGNDRGGAGVVDVCKNEGVLRIVEGAEVFGHVVLGRRHFGEVVRCACDCG